MIVLVAVMVVVVVVDVVADVAAWTNGMFLYRLADCNNN